MRQMLGFIFFWIAVGMCIKFFLESNILAILIILVLLCLAYRFFFC